MSYCREEDEGNSKMYKKYKASKKDCLPISDNDSGSEIPSNICDEITKCWETIDNQSKSFKSDSVTVSRNTKGWKTVRVFVSSTFTDFYNEREVLVKKVFPVVREWAEKHHILVIECDLRWGVPREATTGTAVRVCMEELDRCHEETEGKPFFVLLMGERYGWIPGAGDIPDDVQERYSWVKGTSITHMEILHGAYRSASPNVGIFQRNSQIMKDIPADMLKRFMDEDPTSQYHLQVLKDKLKEKFPNNLFQYDCQVTGCDNSTGKGQVVLSGLETFSEQMVDFLKTSIENTYLKHRESSSLNQYGEEEILHNAIMHSKAEFVVGRDKEMSHLLEFARGESLPEAFVTQSEQTRDEEIRSKQVTCISGHAGLGKSALAASLAVKAKQMGLRVFYHCVGCTADSLRSDNIISRLIYAMQGDNTEEVGNPSPAESLQRAISHQETPLLIILDGLNELQCAESTDHLSWFPSNLSPKIHIIITVNSLKLPSFHRCLMRAGYHISLGEMLPQVSRKIVEKYFQKYGKCLDEADMVALLSHRNATYPLWLALASYELRIYGDFTTLPQKIKSLPDSLPGLLKEITSRLLQEDDTGYMSKLLRLVFCSNGGLPESEICTLLGDRGSSATPVPPVTWATIRTYLKPFLRSAIHPMTRSLRHQFFHASFTEAVGELLFNDGETERLWHEELADHYQFSCSSSSYHKQDLPYHLGRAKLNHRLKDFLQKDKKSVVVPDHFRRQYMKMIRCQGFAFPQGDRKNAVLCSFCRLKTGIFSPIQFAENACFICGCFLHKFVHKEEQLVRFCHKHTRHAHPNHKLCIGCGHVVVPETGVKCYVCISCSSMSQQCCFLNS